MSQDSMYCSLRDSAINALDSGLTSCDLYAKAKEQGETGFSISADFTKAIASIMRQLEKGLEV